MNENQKNRMATIIAGLAATGHYTSLKEVDTGKRRGGTVIYEDTRVLNWTLWDEEEKDRRYDIIEHALTILQEL